MTTKATDPIAWAAFKAGWRACVEAHRKLQAIEPEPGNLHVSYWEWMESEEFTRLHNGGK